MEADSGSPALPGGEAQAGLEKEYALEAFDHREGYCRKLGHYVRFSYCRRRHEDFGPSGSPAAPPPDGQAAPLPCGRVADCWFERLPVEAYLRSNYTAEELKMILAPPPAKLDSILEILARLKAEAGT